MIDFKKLLWEKYRIKYGPKNSYSDYPRRFKTKGIRICAWTNKEKIVPIEFILEYVTSLNKYYVKIEKGGVTGYESASLNCLLKDQSKDWYACAGTPKRWDTLLIKKEDLNPILIQIEDYFKQLTNKE